MSRIPSSNSIQNNSLFVGDLPKFCSEVELEELFTKFGQIIDVKIKRNSNTGKTLSYGFVTFVEETAAAQAMSALDGSMFSGRKLRVRLAMYNTRSQDTSTESIINSVYVKYATLKKVDFFITEEEFHKVFDRFGSVLDVSIKESYIDKRTNKQSGYGFVHFSGDSAGVEAAIQAVANIDNATIDGVTYNVELSKNLLKQFQSSAAGQGNSSSASTSKPAGSGYLTYTDSVPVSPERHLLNEVDPREDYPPSGFASHKGGNTAMKHGAEDYNTLSLSQQDMNYSHGVRGGRAVTYDTLRTTTANPLDHLTHHTYMGQESQSRRRSTAPPSFGGRHPATVNYVGGNSEVHHRPHVPTYRNPHGPEYTPRFMPRPPVQELTQRYPIGVNTADGYAPAPIGNNSQRSYSQFPKDNVSDYSASANLTKSKPYSHVDLAFWQESFGRLDIDDVTPSSPGPNLVSNSNMTPFFASDFNPLIPNTTLSDVGSNFELGHWATGPVPQSLAMHSALPLQPDLSLSMEPSSHQMKMHFSSQTHLPLSPSTPSLSLSSPGHLFAPPLQRMSLTSMYDESSLTQPNVDFAGERNTTF